MSPVKVEEHPRFDSPVSTKRSNQEPVFQPQVAHQLAKAGHAGELNRESEVRVHRGVILDSQDQAPAHSTYKPKFLKRKSSELTELDDVASPPARKKTRVEEGKEKAILTKPVSPKASRKPLAKDISAQINKGTQVREPEESKNIPESSKTLRANVSRINRMKAKDGKRPTASSTPRRRPQVAKSQVPQSIQEPSQIHIKGIAQNVCISGCRSTLTEPSLGRIQAGSPCFRKREERRP